MNGPTGDLKLISCSRLQESTAQFFAWMPRGIVVKPESRKIRRFAVQLPSNFGDKTQRESGTILNLSTQGCAMMTERIPAVSTYVSLQVDLLNGVAPLEIELAGVRWIAGNRCGLEFIRISPQMLARLRSFVVLLENTP